MKKPSERALDGRKRTAEDDVPEIVSSGLALSVAAGWLGITDVATELKDEGGGGAAPTRFHNQQAGLGFTGSKHTAGLAGVEHRLAQKIKYSKSKDEGIRAKVRGSWDDGKAGRAAQKGTGGDAGQQDDKPTKPEQDSESESEGRGAAFSKGKKVGIAQPRGADLLATGGKKRKRRRGGPVEERVHLDR